VTVQARICQPSSLISWLMTFSDSAPGLGAKFGPPAWTNIAFVVAACISTRMLTACTSTTALLLMQRQEESVSPSWIEPKDAESVKRFVGLERSRSASGCPGRGSIPCKDGVNRTSLDNTTRRNVQANKRQSEMYYDQCGLCIALLPDTATSAPITPAPCPIRNINPLPAYVASRCDHVAAPFRTANITTPHATISDLSAAFILST
jgi:hypothetical protein